MKTTILILLASLAACTPAQKNWRSNTSIDIGVGGESTDVNYTYPTLGVSYYLSGVSLSTGVWSDLYGNVGPYWAVGWSWLPFETK